MLKILNLEAGYGALRVLKGISLHVAPGEIVAVIGANGAGKTTLLKTIAGILKARCGEVEFDKRKIHNDPAERIVARGCCLVPEGRHIFSTLTVKENLILGALAVRRQQWFGRQQPEHQRGSGAGLRPLRHPPGAVEPDRRHALRRPAADAGHRPGPDVQAETAHAG